jgi:V/A-type H+-transporting ATPase subunit E
MKDAEAQAAKVEDAAKQNQKAEETLKKNKGGVSIQLETKKLLFEKKKEIMQETYKKALKKLEGIDAKKKKTIVTTLFKKASEQMNIATVYCNAKDTKLLVKKNIKTVANDTIQAGFIAENKNGTVRLDYTFATLFEEVKENTLQKVANMLF